jgi:hypothetical protein
MIKHNKILFLLTIVIIAACKNFESNTSNIIIKDFNSQEWKADSIGCDKRRGTLYTILVNSKKNIINKSRSEISDLLGEPNFKSKGNITYFYFIESGPQCMYVNETGYDSIEVKKLLVDFEKDKVKDVYIIVP